MDFLHFPEYLYKKSFVLFCFVNFPRTLLDLDLTVTKSCGDEQNSYMGQIKI